MFVIFHGNLVHNGARAKVEPVDGSMNYAADMRAFAYIHQYKPKRIQMKKDGLIPRVTHSEDPTVGTTVVQCPKMKDMNNKCECCEKFFSTRKAKELSSDGFEINLEREYMKKQARNIKEKYLTPIVGDLKNFGWAVYEGVNTWEVNSVGTLQEDCRDLMNRSIPKVEWNDLQHTSRAPKCGRYHLRITTDMLLDMSVGPKVYKTLKELYLCQILKKIKTIENFEDTLLNEIQLICNRGPVAEQKAHRDYEPIHKC